MLPVIDDMLRRHSIASFYLPLALCVGLIYYKKSIIIILILLVVCGYAYYLLLSDYHCACDEVRLQGRPKHVEDDFSEVIEGFK